jgi:molecular chaperone HscA
VTRRATPSAPSTALKLDRSLLDAEVDENWTACIDFGTAFSKIVMVRRHETGATTTEHVRPLQIGPANLSGFSPLMCPSALYVVQERIHFGERAFIVHANHGADNRQRFESPKHYISALNQQLLETPANEAEDPTQRFTRAQLLLLLLGFIIFRFDRALRAEKFPMDRLPQLRIARPAWKRAFERDGEALLLDLLARAMILARTIGARYDTNEGLTIELALAVLQAVNQVAEPSAQLQTKLIRADKPNDCIQRGFVPEATAVAAAAIRPEQNRQRVFVIADIGAGTSDFGAFIAVPGRNRQGRIGEYAKARRIEERAGNFLDSQVVSYLIRKNGLNAGLPSDVGTIAALKREARRYKEELFRDEELLGPLRGDLRELLAEPEMAAFADDLRGKFGETLHVLEQRPPVRVLLTGGGAELPFVRGLASMPAQKRVPIIEEDPTPSWVAGTNWNVAFRQLAVAVGGAMPSLPEQR